MADRHMLAIHKLDEFKQWLDLVGIEHRPTTADWQVMQVRLPGDPRWHAIYQKANARERLSVPGPLAGLVRAFVSESDPYSALAEGQRQNSKMITFALRYGSPTRRIVQPYQPVPHQLPIPGQPRISMNRCCEKAVPLGVVVCPDCLEMADAYGSQSAPPDDTPPWD